MLIFPPILRRPKGITLAFQEADNSTSNLTTYTFSGKALGTAASNRQIVVLVSGHGTSNTTVSTVTVGGVSATELVYAQQATGTQIKAIWIASVPTGTTGDVVVTFAAGKGSCGIGVYALYGASSSAHATQTDTTYSTDTVSVSIDVPAGGVCFAIGTGTAIDASTTWTGLTEDYDAVEESGNRHTGASDLFASAQTGLTVSAQVANVGGGTGCLAAASVGPS